MPSKMPPLLPLTSSFFTGLIGSALDYKYKKKKGFHRKKVHKRFNAKIRTLGSIEGVVVVSAFRCKRLVKIGEPGGAAAALFCD